MRFEENITFFKINYMSKGLKAHIYSTILFLVPIFILLFENKEPIPIQIRYVLSMGYCIIQIGVGVLCYLENWYDEKES